MRLDAQSPLIWRQINQIIKEKLGTQSNVLLYRGMHQAIFETCLGLNLRFGHKRKIVSETGFGDHLSHVEIELAKQGVRLKDQFEEDMAKEEKACLAYIHDLDDALTAELYDHIETLKALAPTKVYKIHLAHHLFHVRKSFVKSLTDFDIIIASLNQDYALVFTGEKIVLPTLTVAQLPWSLNGDAKPVLELIDNEQETFQPEITKFETSLPAGVVPWFTDQPARRIYDRAVVILQDHDGAAMMELLNKELAVDQCGLGNHNRVESPSLCRWQNDSWFKQAEKFGRTKEEMQGTLMIDGSLVNPEFSKTFASCLERLKLLSS